MTWSEQVVAALSGGRVQNCEAGHSAHNLVSATVRLDGPAAIPDWPPIPPEHARSLDLMIYDRDRYQDETQFCTGNDDVSRTIALYGMWEGFETVTALAVLAGGHGGWCVDVGAQLGWFTLLAATSGVRTIAVEANPENLELLARNCERNRCANLVVPIRGWIDSEAPAVPAGDRIRLLKADIEGLEVDAVRVLEASFAAGDVDFVLVELTPAFNDDWRQAAAMLDRYGMVGFRIPDKGEVDVDKFSADPFAVLATMPFDPAATFNQVNALFVREALL